jgi:hypothetical protein
MIHRVKELISVEEVEGTPTKKSRPAAAAKTEEAPKKATKAKAATAEATPASEEKPKKKTAKKSEEN